MKKIFTFLVLLAVLISPLGTMAESKNPVVNSDMCLNIPNDQATVPNKYYQKDDNCYISPVPGQPNRLDPDYCFNIPGIQTELPGLYPEWSRTDKGNCVENIDICPNIIGMQTGAPKNMAIVDGQCVSSLQSVINGLGSSADMCLNIAGYQTNIPNKYYQESGNCYIAHVAGQPDTLDPDYCKNVPYIQTKLPTGKIFRNDKGNCN